MGNYKKDIIDAILHVQSQPIQDQKSMHIVVYLK